MKYIVYESNAGHTKEYAKLIGEALNLDAYSLEEACTSLEKNSEILYMGWLMAGEVKGYKKANQLFHIVALCGVGMAKNASQIEDIRKNNHVENDIPIYNLQGGFEMEKLHGVYKFMMNAMKKSVGKSLEKKEEKTQEEMDMLELMIHGKDCVSKENVNVFLNWLKGVNV